MNITNREADALLSLLRTIRIETCKPNRRRYAIENLCDRATVIINKAKRRETNKH